MLTAEEQIKENSGNGFQRFFTDLNKSSSDEIDSIELTDCASCSSEDLSSSASNFKPTTLSWNNLNVYSKGSSGLTDYFRKPKEPVHIIKKVSGQAKPGNLLAILGASGAGKTTLLNVLTGQNLNKLAIEGQVSLNNEPITIERLSSCSSYVQQDDLFFGVLTVREHLRFQLKLRTTFSMNASQINKRIDQILEKLGLMKVAENRIKCGSSGERLSGGELKRLSIATEILTDPAILFCDEPTSGLDSFMAQTVVSVLKSLANEQRTIVCTIHQPSSEIFKMFDQIMLLAEGRVAFLGTADKALDFFSQLGFKCPSNYNPSDFYVQQLSIVPGNKEQCLSKVNMICNSYEASDYHRDLRSELKIVSEATFEAISGPAKLKQYSKPVQIDIFSQFNLLTHRSALINFRDPMLTTSRIASTLFCTLLVALAYWGQDYNQEGIMNINGAIFLSIMSGNFSGIYLIIGTFCNEMPLFLREHAAGLYRVSIYFIAKMASDLPYFILLPIATWSICYYAIGLVNDFDTFLIGNAVSIILMLAAAGFGYFISSISTSLIVGLEVASPLISPLSLLGGTFVNNRTIPKWINWIKYFSWFYYSNEILTVNQWRDVTHIDCDFETPVPSSIVRVLPEVSKGTLPTGQGCLVNGKQVIASVGFKESNLKLDYWMLIFVIVIFRVLAYVALRGRVKLQR
ncbi:protein white-like isoform X2 [Tetranychus urticae]|uniref:ABC transporter domain-containing protein n=1 Tax=Tetranychus urticae TaxID=32264 RepID=T1KD75_TETUR|nr:protein white-like isoform X2 [Tetranychus urticae]